MKRRIVFNSSIRLESTPNMGVGTSRTLQMQGAIVLGMILYHRDNETQLWFLAGKCRMTGMGRDLSYLPLRHCHQHPAKLSLLITPTSHQTMFLYVTIFGYWLPPMGQTLIRTRISVCRNVSLPKDFLHNR